MRRRMRLADAFLAGLLVLVVFPLLYSAVATGQVVPAQGITKAQAPLVRVGNTVILDTAGGITIAHLKATIGTFGNLTVTGTCTGCGSGGGGGGTGGTGSSTVSLTRLGPMLADWRANSGVFSDTACSVVVNTGGGIGCWHDLTGHGNDVVQASGGAQPIWLPNDQAGLPAVYFLGAQVLAAASPSHRTGTGVSSCVIVRPAVTSGQASVVGDWDNGAAKGWLTGFSSNASSFEGIRSVIFHGSGLDLHQNVMPALTPHSFCATYDGTTDTLYYDGAAVSAGAATLSFGTSTYLVGATTTALAEPFLGDVYEAFVYDTGLTPALVGSADLYARQYWGTNSYATAVSGGSSGGGGSISDPITVNGWTPGSGTGTVAGSLAVTGGATDTGHTTTGDAHITGNLTVDGAISGIGLVYSYLPFHVDSLSSSTSTNQNEASFLVQKAMTLVACTFTPTTQGFSSDTCSHLIVDATGGGTVCTVSTSCATNTSTSANCTGTSIPANHFLTYKRTIAGLFSGTAAPGNFACSFSEQP